MRFLKLLPVVACGLSLAGCTRVLSLHQVAPDKPVPVEPALAGVWTDDEAKAFYKIEVDEAAYTITYSSPDVKVPVKLRGQLLAAGDPVLLDLVSADENAFSLNCHAVARVWLEGDRLRVAFLDSEWLENEARQALPSTKVKDGQTLILAPGAAVRAFMLAGGKDERATGDVEELHRVR